MVYTLVVFDTESTFPSQENVRCIDERGINAAFVSYTSKFHR